MTNPVRGEVQLDLNGQIYELRPTYAALVAAEAEIGSLFAVVESATDGQLKLADMMAVLWYCHQAAQNGGDRITFAENCMAAGLARLTPAFRSLMEQVLGGA